VGSQTESRTKFEEKEKREGYYERKGGEKNTEIT